MQQPVTRIDSWRAIEATIINKLDGDRLHKGTAFWPDKIRGRGDNFDQLVAQSQIESQFDFDISSGIGRPYICKRGG